MRRRREQAEEFSDINITPFTDIVLVLLIIFMITSPIIMTGAIKVNLPKASTAETTATTKTEIYLTENNELYLNNKQITLDNLSKLLPQEFIVTGSEVALKADANAKHGVVVQVLDIIKQAGATKLLIATGKK